MSVCSRSEELESIKRGEYVEVGAPSLKTENILRKKNYLKGQFDKYAKCLSDDPHHTLKSQNQTNRNDLFISFCSNHYSKTIPPSLETLTLTHGSLTGFVFLSSSPNTDIHGNHGDQ